VIGSVQDRAWRQAGRAPEAECRSGLLRHPIADHLILGVADLVEVDQRLLAVIVEGETNQRARGAIPW
jgi:hypothetical protein